MPDGVSIQPKPKTGLEEQDYAVVLESKVVSIQPKPKTGLEVIQKYGHSV